jgi:hypothetical protein
LATLPKKKKEKRKKKKTSELVPIAKMKKSRKQGHGKSLGKEKSITVYKEGAFPNAPTIKFHSPNNVREARKFRP